MSYFLAASVFLAVHGINPTTYKSCGSILTSLHQCFFIVEHIIPCGERAVETYGIFSGYLVSSKLIQAGQHEV